MYRFSIAALFAIALASCADSPATGPDLTGIPAPPAAPASIADRNVVIDWIIVDKAYPNATYNVALSYPAGSDRRLRQFDTAQGVWIHNILYPGSIYLSVARIDPPANRSVSLTLTKQEYRRVRIDF